MEPGVEEDPKKEPGLSDFVPRPSGRHASNRLPHQKCDLVLVEAIISFVQSTVDETFYRLCNLNAKNVQVFPETVPMQALTARGRFWSSQGHGLRERPD
jgi:hypothetical protein